MAGIFKIGISENTKYDILVGFPISGHIYISSVKCQLFGQKAIQFFCQLKYLIEGTIALIQWVDSIEQCSDAYSHKANGWSNNHSHKYCVGNQLSKTTPFIESPQAIMYQL